MDQRQAIYISDLSRCHPAAALSPHHRKYHWQTVPYEAENVAGNMLIAGPETEAPNVTLPLGIAGWHAIFVGIWSNWTDDKLKIRMSGDRVFTSIIRELPNNFAIDERFWKCADLTGQDIVFGQQSTGFSKPAYVAYVKLVPLSDDEVQALLADRANPENKRLVAMNDAFNVLTRPRPTTVEGLWEEIEPYRDTDFHKIFWGNGVGGDVVTYASQIAELAGTGQTDFPRVMDRNLAESVQILHAKGIDPLRAVVEYAHSIGLELHASQRMEAFQCCAPFDEFFTGPLYRNHPEWRCVDVDGREIARMSYAFPGVQDYVLAMFEEVATGYDIDGINPIFNRGAPFLLYEQPLVEGFMARTGLDPRQIDERDERYLLYRSGVMTDFMRRLRRLMDEIGRRRGRRLQVSAHVLKDEESNFFYGLDVPAWVREGIIDNLIAYPWRNEEIDVEYFGRLVQGTGVKYYPEVMPRRLSPEEYRQRAIKYYAAGADGLCFWDTYERHPVRAEWSMIRRLGHRDELASWTDGEGDLFRTVKLRSVGGMVLDKYPPHWAY